MSKHLRFGKLLGMLAIMLTLSLAWSQAQNLSSQKQLLTFGFTTAANPAAQLGSDVTGTIDQTAHTVAISVPFEAVVTGLKASFTSSQFSNVFGGVLVPTLPVSVSGVSPALDYTTAKTWTVEAENHSYENYVVTLTKLPASAAKDISTFGASISKPWLGNCASNGPIAFTAAGAFAGNAITFPVPFGSNLDAITVNYIVSPYATGVPATATAVDFDTNNDGTPEAVSFVITAQNGSTKSYTVLPVVGLPSFLDNLLSFTMANSTSMVITRDPGDAAVVKTVNVTVPFSATTFTPVWTISEYAKMFAAEPPVVPNFVTNPNICSGVTYLLAGATTTMDFWIQGEKTTEKSKFVLTITKDPASALNLLTSVTAGYSKVNTCYAGAPAYTGSVVGTIDQTAKTIVFNVPFGVASVTVTANTLSALVTPATFVGTVLTTGSTVAVTSESGLVNTYTVTVTPVTATSNKQMLTFGFNMAQNNAPWAFPDWTVNYAGVIDQVSKHVTVTVAWNTDLHDLIAYFTTSDFSCVRIAESNGALTPQVTMVTVNDHSNTLTYVVTAEDGTQERYDVMVLKAPALTDNLITAFSITGLNYCPLVSAATFSVAGTITGNNISVVIPNRSAFNLASLAYSFTASNGATVTPSVSPASFAAPVTFTVTSQSGAVNTYTVTVTKRADVANPSSRKQLTKYWFDGIVNGIGSTANGVIDETAKTVTVWVPWGTNMGTLKAGFELNGGLGNYTGGVVMTHSEDPQVMQVTNVTPNDFTTPVAYTVFAEDCSTVEYFVTVNMTPATGTGISAFTFAVTPCATGCALTNTIDAYARRIYITVPNSVSITSLAPATIVIAPSVNGLPAASVTPAAGVAQNWTNGPVKYTVTAPDGVTKADWMVYVTNPACKEHDILTFSLPFAQVAPADLVAGHGSPVTIDAVNHKIDVIIKAGTSLTSIAYTRTLSCGATICCVGGNCQDNQFLDFSVGGCHTCVVTAEDTSVKQDWTICVRTIDVTVPTVETWSVMAYNCTDSVAVKSNEAGRVFIINELALNKAALPSWIPSTYKLADWTGAASVTTSVNALVAARMGAWASVSDAQVNTPVYVKTNGLYSGYYWAYSVDNAGNISCISAQKLFLDICEVDIATICSLRDQPDVWRYRLTKEAIVSYEENRVGGNWKFIQDATCGILIEDRLGALPATAYGQGAGVTNIIGMLDKSGDAIKLIPVCCYLPTKSSTGNVIVPIEYTYDAYVAGPWVSRANESMLVKITTPMMIDNDYGQGPNWVYDNLDLHTVTAMGGTNMYLVQSVLNSPLIGTAIPTVPVYLTGVRTNLKWTNVMGFLTPRKAADMVPVTGTILTAVPNPVTISGVVVNFCGTATVKIYNEGVTAANITALYLDDNAATDGFNLLTPPVVPFTIGSWANQGVTVNFCPTVAGNKSTNLIVEYGIGKTLVIPINGTTMLIYNLPFSETFESSTPPAAWNSLNMIYGNYGNGLTVGNGYLYGWSWVTPNSVKPIWVITPGINLGSVANPTLTFRLGTVFSSQFRVDVSTNYSTWTTVKDYGNYTLGNGVGAVMSVDLTAYAGQTIYIRFYSSTANYIGVDDVKVDGKVTVPILSLAPLRGDFGGVQIGSTANIDYSIKNTGVSILKIKGITVTGAGFSLTDTNTYPVEVTDGPGTWAYTVGNTASELKFSVKFTPTDLGVKTGKVVITYGLYADQTVEIPLTAEGLSCSTAVDVTVGEHNNLNNTWWKYTAEKFQITTITSCDPRNTVVPYSHSYDSYVYVYSDCDGTLITSNDDMEGACPTNRANSSVTVVMNAGETIYIFWSGEFNSTATNLHGTEPFYWHINPSYPIDGDVCETAIPLTLPVVNHFGTTVGFADDYNASPCSPFSNYMDGNDKVYTITLPYEGYLTGNILGAYGSIHVLDICPTEVLEKFHCKAYVGGPNGGQFEKKIAAGTYFVIISTWSPPQTVDYLLNMSFRGTGVENNELMSNLNVYPNPTNGKFAVTITNVEAMDMTLELVNISGQVVYRNAIKAAYSYNEDIDASSFAKGVYYLKVNNGKDVKVEKVVIQ